MSLGTNLTLEFADKHRFYHFILPQKLHRVVYTFRQKSIKKTRTLKRIYQSTYQLSPMNINSLSSRWWTSLQFPARDSFSNRLLKHNLRRSNDNSETYIITTYVHDRFIMYSHFIPSSQYIDCSTTSMTYFREIRYFMFNFAFVKAITFGRNISKHNCTTFLFLVLDISMLHKFPYSLIKKQFRKLESLKNSKINYKFPSPIPDFKLSFLKSCGL